MIQKCNTHLQWSWQDTGVSSFTSGHRFHSATQWNFVGDITQWFPDNWLCSHCKFLLWTSVPRSPCSNFSLGSCRKTTLDSLKPKITKNHWRSPNPSSTERVPFQYTVTWKLWQSSSTPCGRVRPHRTFLRREHAHCPVWGTKRKGKGSPQTNGDGCRPRGDTVWKFRLKTIKDARVVSPSADRDPDAFLGKTIITHQNHPRNAAGVGPCVTRPY
jgi:hypothetical protein